MVALDEVVILRCRIFGQYLAGPTIRPGRWRRSVVGKFHYYYGHRCQRVFAGCGPGRPELGAVLEPGAVGRQQRGCWRAGRRGTVRIPHCWQVLPGCPAGRQSAPICPDVQPIPKIGAGTGCSSGDKRRIGWKRPLINSPRRFTALAAVQHHGGSQHDLKAHEPACRNFVESTYYRCSSGPAAQPQNAPGKYRPPGLVRA